MTKLKTFLEYGEGEKHPTESDWIMALGDHPGQTQPHLDKNTDWLEGEVDKPMEPDLDNADDLKDLSARIRKQRATPYRDREINPFGQFLQESDINDLQHNIPLKPKSVAKMTADKGVFKDFNVEVWKDQSPPANDSEEVKKELKVLEGLVAMRDDYAKRQFMYAVDKRINRPFKKYFKEHDLDEKLIANAKPIIENSHTILLPLKLHYNRPRPYHLARKLAFNRQLAFTISNLETAVTPSYPSGHACQGRLLAKILAEQVPFQHRLSIMRIGDEIGSSRMMGGVHYPSDTDFGRDLADSLFNHLTNHKEAHTMNSFKQISEDLIMEAGLSGKDLFSRDNKERFIKLTDSGELVDRGGKKLSVDKSLWKIMKKQLQDAESWDELKPQWTNFKSAFGGIAISGIDKGLNDMSGGKGGQKGPSGEDWEAMIVLGQMKNNNQSFEGSDEWNRIEPKGFWDDDYNRETSLKLGKAFEQKKLGSLTQTGSGKDSKGFTKEWKEWGGKSATPKTDLFNKSPKQRISLKKKGGSQVMSAKKFEAIATFEAAKTIMGESHPKEAGEIVDKMKTLVMSFDEKIDKKLGVVDAKDGAYKGSVEDLEKSKGKDPLTIAHKKKMAEIRKGGAELDKKLAKLFQDSPEFKTSFVFEAASGYKKFGDKSNDRADIMVEFDVDKQAISSTYKMVKPSDVQKLSTYYALYFAFKSSSGSSPFMSLRGALYQTPQQATAKTMKMINAGYEPNPMTLNGILTEGLKQEDVGQRVLHESRIEQLDEFAMLNKIKKGLSAIQKKVRDKFKKMWNWMKDKILKAFDWIKKQGAKMLDVLMQFFGKVVSNVKVTGSGPELFSEKA